MLFMRTAMTWTVSSSATANPAARAPHRALGVEVVVVGRGVREPSAALVVLRPLAVAKRWRELWGVLWPRRSRLVCVVRGCRPSPVVVATAATCAGMALTVGSFAVASGPALRQAANSGPSARRWHPPQTSVPAVPSATRAPRAVLAAARGP